MAGLINDVFDQVAYIPRAIVFTLFLIPIYCFLRDNDRNAIKSKIIHIFKQPWLMLYLIYLSYILINTIFARSITNPYRNIFSHFGIIIDEKWNLELIENTLLFIPYTFLFLQAHNRARPWKSALTISFITTLFIEFSQLLFWLGEFQVSDILHNIVGGMIGCFLWYAVHSLI